MENLTNTERKFLEILKKHSFGDTVTIDVLEDIDRQARTQYLSNHGKEPKLEEIDRVINEYREGGK